MDHSDEVNQEEFQCGQHVIKMDTGQRMIIEDVAMYKALCSFVEDNVYYREWFMMDDLIRVYD